MRLLIPILLIGLAIVSGCGKSDELPISTPSTLSTHGLQSFVDVKLDNDLKTELAEAYKKITREELENKSCGLRPYWLKEFNSGEARWLLLSVYPGYNVPDISYVESHIFDTEWKRIAKQDFPTGYRMFLDNASIIQLPGIDSDVLVITTTPTGPFIIKDEEKKKPLFLDGNFTRQYYGFSENTFVVIRLENDESCILINSYAWKVPDIGPSPPKLTVEQWLNRLSSKNTVDVLSALVWLTGSHIPSAEKRTPAVNQESVEDSQLYESVRDNPQTIQILEALKEHNNDWIKEYAKIGFTTYKSGITLPR